MTYTVFEILTNKARKWLVFLTLPLFDAPSQNRLEFSEESSQKLETGGYCKVKIS